LHRLVKDSFCVVLGDWTLILTVGNIPHCWLQEEK